MSGIIRRTELPGLPLFEKSVVDHLFANGCLKEQRKVLENSLKMYLKSP